MGAAVPPHTLVTSPRAVVLGLCGNPLCRIEDSAPLSCALSVLLM